MMKKIITFFVAAMIAVSTINAQTLAEGIKNINYEKTKTAISILKKLYDANPKDPQTIYWYGQALLAAEGTPTPEQLNAAKAVYQKALTDGVNDPFIWIGMGHVELLQGGDLNSAKQKFEQAITATKTKKGENPDILNAIGRANADGNSTTGDPLYGIEKLKRAAELNKTNPDIYINMGICYRKLGGENGGDAVNSFLNALARDPKNVIAQFQIGQIYLSQNNKEALESSFNGAISADPTFPLAYLSLFKYYSEKDVNKAKDYLDNYIKYADKDPLTDYWMADYLFRAGKYNESLAKAKEIEASVPAGSMPRINILYAYNYDRLGDSVQAKSYAEKFFTVATPKIVQPSDYDLAVKIFSKFPGSEMEAVGYLEKAIAADPSKENKIMYADQAATLLGKGKLYTDQLKWYQKVIELKGTTSEFDYYNLSTIALNAKDYVQGMAIAKKYIAAFPDKSQGYFFNVKAAKAIDSATAIDPIIQQNEFLMKDSVKNKKFIFNNYYFLLVYYVDKMKDNEKGLEICDKMLSLYPEPGEENDFILKTKDVLQKALAPQPPAKKPASKSSTGFVSGKVSGGAV
ncbi:beta-barrel assembly-enhancing protease [mine drainage metagenome]|uniref:Beta-barrel assembly-enhancing protease n=1 Tax=mine drainage metagenome TaxID=410659 RepID=A0A1J5T7F7_9ZZZZ